MPGWDLSTDFVFRASEGSSPLDDRRTESPHEEKAYKVRRRASDHFEDDEDLLERSGEPGHQIDRLA